MVMPIACVFHFNSYKDIKNRNPQRRNFLIAYPNSLEAAGFVIPKKE
jgi:hypothetical protein